MHKLRFALFSCPLIFAIAANLAGAPEPRISVETEETVYRYTPPDNGASPLWCYGSTVIVRAERDVFVSQMETGEGVPPLCNTRWRLLRRDGGAWSTVDMPDEFRQREPCPLAVTEGGKLFLYVNDSLTEPGTHYQPCKPYLRQYAIGGGEIRPADPIEPEWPGEPYFTDHSYRGFGADGVRGQLLMLNIDAETSELHYALLDTNGETRRNGGITFPIRACYPQAALQDGAAYVLAIGDIVEPVEEWREFKAEQTGRAWDYVFRILYFTYSPDILNQDFAKPIEIANVDATAGHIRNQDLWIAPDGRGYILYTEQEVASELMRDRFFPDKSILTGLNLAIVEDGAVTARRGLIQGTDSAEPGAARFHEDAQGRLFVVYYLDGETSGMRIMEIDTGEGEPVLSDTLIPMETTFPNFTVATPRSGTRPSNHIDILGAPTGASDTMAYAHIVIGD